MSTSAAEIREDLRDTGPVDVDGYLPLSDGLTHYRIEGPRDGIPLVMLHGATVSLWEYDCLAPYLNRAGFRTLRFDFYGHGTSSPLDVPYTFDRFARQTLELMEATGFPRPAAVMGHSVGAAIAAGVASECPQWTDRLVLVAPMLDFNARTRLSLAFRCPGIGEALMRFVGLPALIRRRDRSYAGTGRPHLAQRFREETSFAGLGQALLSMARSATLGDQSARYAALAALNREVMVIWGRKDRIVPARHIGRLRALLREHRYIELHDGRHNLPMAEPESVALAVRAFAT
jgi:pimeloyl-ACP methyl ester carboxylesterase